MSNRIVSRKFSSYPMPGTMRFAILRAHYKAVCIAGTMLLFLTGSPGSALAQLRGMVADKARGVQYVVPDGWIAEQTARGLRLLPEEAGCGQMEIVFHIQISIDSLRQFAAGGFHDEDGTHLVPANEVSPYTEQGLEAVYTGTANWQPAEALLLAVLSPYGNGCSVLVAAGQDEPVHVCRRIAETFLRSVVFSKPQDAAVPTR